jgi:hypothetical protein
VRVRSSIVVSYLMEDEIRLVSAASNPVPSRPFPTPFPCFLMRCYASMSFLPAYAKCNCATIYPPGRTSDHNGSECCPKEYAAVGKAEMILYVLSKLRVMLLAPKMMLSCS